MGVGGWQSWSCCPPWELLKRGERRAGNGSQPPPPTPSSRQRNQGPRQTHTQSTHSADTAVAVSQSETHSERRDDFLSNSLAATCFSQTAFMNQSAKGHFASRGSTSSAEAASALEPPRRWICVFVLLFPFNLSDFLLFPSICLDPPVLRPSRCPRSSRLSAALALPASLPGAVLFSDIWPDKGESHLSAGLKLL